MKPLNWYVLDPIDLLLMREAKPFSPGDGSWAKGQFPPMPTTVFQAMRSATPWRSSRDRRERDLDFVGPFLLYEPPGQPPSMWLPTPQDLICIRSGTDTEEADLIETATQWERTARLQPLDRENPAWQFLGFDSDFFKDEQLVPMVPPAQKAEEGGDRNTYLRVSESSQERFAGRPKPWMRAEALVRYLQGEVLENPAQSSSQTDESEAKDYFTDNPWTTQVLPHIKVQTGTRQVADEEGYFTEVAIRMRPYWHLVAGISTELDAKVVRLGGEGHRALVSPLPAPPPEWSALQALRAPTSHSESAYVLTPGLAEASEARYGLIPADWQASLRSCVGDRALLWGGMSVFRKNVQTDGQIAIKQNVAFQPQRAFVPPGTVYRFKPGELPVNEQSDTEELKLLPTGEAGWLETFNKLNYGLLLWGQ